MSDLIVPPDGSMVNIKPYDLILVRSGGNMRLAQFLWWNPDGTFQAHLLIKRTGKIAPGALKSGYPFAPDKFLSGPYKEVPRG